MKDEKKTTVGRRDFLRKVGIGTVGAGATLATPLVTSAQADSETGEYPRVRDDLVMHQRADDGHQHAKLGEVHAALGRFGMAHALQSKDEKDGSEQVAEFDEVSLHFCLLRFEFRLSEAYSFFATFTLFSRRRDA